MTTTPHISVPRWRPSLKMLPVSDVGEFNVAIDNLNSRKKKINSKNSKKDSKKVFWRKMQKIRNSCFKLFSAWPEFSKRTNGS